MPEQLGDKSDRPRRKARRADADAARESAAKRGYGHEWRTRTRIWVLRRDPICVIDGCNEASTDVDHIIPKRMGGPDTPENLQGLCGHHHKVKTANESAFKTKTTVQRFVVSGPPASGKSHWIDEHAEQGDLVFDADDLSAVIFGRCKADSTSFDRAIMKVLSSSMIGWLQLNAEHNDVYISITDKDAASEVAKKLHATLVVMNSTQDECIARVQIARVQADPKQQHRTREQIKAINSWFGKFGHAMEITTKTAVPDPETGGAGFE